MIAKAKILMISGILAAMPAASWAGSYCGAAGTTGSSAIHKDSSAFVEWASDCHVSRGYMNISSPSSGYASSGVASNGTGKADNGIVSLGDAGCAVLTFDKAIRNGAGYDFAVFENGFSDTFLELAFVEVSSDGSNYFRFDAVSETSTSTQVGSFGAVDPTNLNNLAGKYRVQYGTPFDLAELDGVSDLLDVDNVTYVKVIDVVGCIQDGYCTYDSKGNKVNDTWATGFVSGGFDLDAVGVINQIPEPCTIVLIVCAAIAIAIREIRRKKQVFARIVAAAANSRYSNNSYFFTTLNRRNVMLKEKSFGANCAIVSPWILLLAAGLGSFAEQATAAVATFDESSLALPDNSFWKGVLPNGTDSEVTVEGPGYSYDYTISTGSFASGGIDFTNIYNKSWDSWGGFTYSSGTDTTATVVGTSYSDYVHCAVTGIGYGNSRNYGIGYGYLDSLDATDITQLQQLPYLTLPNAAALQNAYITNTTYAAMSMLNGDGFAKKFGGTTGNDADWLKLTIYGSNASGNILSNKVEFYLADYQSLNNSLDYIVDEWTAVDLSSLADANRLYFNITSSDTGTYGMNSPGCFAIDSITYTVPEPSTIVIIVTALAAAACYKLRRRRIH